MDIQIKNVDAVIEACEGIKRTLIYHYGEEAGNWGMYFLGWESNAEDKKLIDEKLRKLNENTTKLYFAMKNFNDSLLKYATNIKTLSSKRSDN